MTIGVNFRDRSYAYTNVRYSKEITSMVKSAIEGLDCTDTYYFSKTSESVYVLISPRTANGYVLFTIKGHKMSGATSIKVFNTSGYIGFKELTRDIRNFVIESIRGSYPLFKFKYGNYLGLTSVISISKMGYKIIAPRGSISDSVTLVKGSKMVKLTDKVFLNRLVKLVNTGIVREYESSRGKSYFYVTDIGFKLYNEQLIKYESQYKQDLSSNALDGIVEQSIDS